MIAYLVLLGSLFLVTLIVAYAFYVQLTALKSADKARGTERDDAIAANQKAQKELDSAREELARRKSSETDLREKLNDLRSRQHKQRESERKQKTSSAEVELQEQLDAAHARLDDERARVDVLTREAGGMQDELSRLKDTHRRVEEALKAAQAAATRAANEPAAAAPAPAAPKPMSPEAEQRRVDVLERQTREARRKAGELEEELKKARTKGANATRMQLLTRNELDLFKEKMVWSEKRVVELERLLFENKVALPEREVAPQPKAPQVAPGVLAREAANTGGEGVVAVSADYVPEAEPSEAAVEVQAAAATQTEGEAEIEALAEVAAASADIIPTEPERPEAVPPIRRPKAALDPRADEAAKQG